MFEATYSLLSFSMLGSSTRKHWYSKHGTVIPKCGLCRFWQSSCQLLSFSPTEIKKPQQSYSCWTKKVMEELKFCVFQQ